MPGAVCVHILDRIGVRTIKQCICPVNNAVTVFINCITVCCRLCYLLDWMPGPACINISRIYKHKNADKDYKTEKNKNVLFLNLDFDFHALFLYLGQGGIYNCYNCWFWILPAAANIN